MWSTFTYSKMGLSTVLLKSGGKDTWTTKAV